MSDFYAVLGVAKSASLIEVRAAYRKLAMRHHPDKGGDAEVFKTVNAAHETLSCPEKRAQYDRKARAAPVPAARASSDPWQQWTRDMAEQAKARQEQRKREEQEQQARREQQQKEWKARQEKWEADWQEQLRQMQEAREKANERYLNETVDLSRCSALWRKQGLDHCSSKTTKGVPCKVKLGLSWLLGSAWCPRHGPARLASLLAEWASEQRTSRPAKVAPGEVAGLKDAFYTCDERALYVRIQMVVGELRLGDRVKCGEMVLGTVVAIQAGRLQHHVDSVDSTMPAVVKLVLFDENGHPQHLIRRVLMQVEQDSDLTVF